MGKGDRYRLIIIISFIILIICSLTLLISLWNKLSMNPGIHAGPTLYILVVLIIILSIVIFTLHLFEEQQVLFPHESGEKNILPVQQAKNKTAEPFKAPFEVDIDEIAENIVPRINTGESIEDFTEKILQNLVNHFDIVQGIIFLKDSKTNEFRSVSTYAYTSEGDPASV